MAFNPHNLKLFLTIWKPYTVQSPWSFIWNNLEFRWNWGKHCRYFLRAL